MRALRKSVYSERRIGISLRDEWRDMRHKESRHSVRDGHGNSISNPFLSLFSCLFFVERNFPYIHLYIGR